MCTWCFCTGVRYVCGRNSSMFCLYWVRRLLWSSISPICPCQGLLAATQGTPCLLIMSIHLPLSPCFCLTFQLSSAWKNMNIFYHYHCHYSSFSLLVVCKCDICSTEDMTHMTPQSPLKSHQSQHVDGDKGKVKNKKKNDACLHRKIRKST